MYGILTKLNVLFPQKVKLLSSLSKYTVALSHNKQFNTEVHPRYSFRYRSLVDALRRSGAPRAYTSNTRMAGDVSSSVSSYRLKYTQHQCSIKAVYQWSYCYSINVFLLFI